MITAGILIGINNTPTTQTAVMVSPRSSSPSSLPLRGSSASSAADWHRSPPASSSNAFNLHVPFAIGAVDVGDAHHVRFARFSVDCVHLAYADAEAERLRDVWDLRLFGLPGKRRLDFTTIRQHWLREAAKAWSATTSGQVGEMTLRDRVGSVAVLSAVLAAEPGGGENPEVLERADVERFLARIHSPAFRPSQRSFGIRARVHGSGHR